MFRFIVHFLICSFIRLLVSGETILRAKKLQKKSFGSWGLQHFPRPHSWKNPTPNSGFGLDFRPFGPHTVALWVLPSLLGAPANKFVPV